MKRFRCVTFGCRVNQYETQAIREQLLTHGYQETPPGDPTDLVVMNSCTVTESADKECLEVIRTLHKEDPQAKIIVVGCLVQKDAEFLKKLSGISLLLGSNQKHRLLEFVEGLDSWALEPRVETQMNRVYAPLRISTFDGRSKAFLKVQDGCDRACAFCKIPLVRGRARSRELSDLLEEVRRLRERGFREIVLTGVALGLWGQEDSSSQGLADLVGSVDQIPGRFRIRLSSLDPRDLEDRFIETLCHSKKVCHHLHLSLQSGADAVLQRMNRGYTTRWYREKVEKIRREWPDLGLTTDLIVGFPGETENLFEETLRFCEEISFAKIHVFPYSPRRGTSAWFFKDRLPPSVVKQRARVMREVGDRIAIEFRQRFLGTTQEVLAEEVKEVGNGQSLLTGSTGQFLKVEFLGFPDGVGTLLPVQIQELRRGRLFGHFSLSALDKLTHPVPSLI